jgi:hypothetical protein
VGTRFTARALRARVSEICTRCVQVALGREQRGVRLSDTQPQPIREQLRHLQAFDVGRDLAIRREHARDGRHRDARDLETIRTRPECDALPVIILTTEARQSLMDRAEKAGAKGCLTLGRALLGHVERALA